MAMKPTPRDATMAAFAAQVETAPVTAPAPEMIETVAPNTVAGAQTAVEPGASVPEPGTVEPKFDTHMPVATVSASNLVGLSNALGTTPAALLDAMVRSGLLPKAEAARVPL